MIGLFQLRTETCWFIMDPMRSALQIPSLLLCIAAFGMAQQAKIDATAEWRYMKKDDPLHAKVYDKFLLEGVYLTPPRVVNGAPALVVECVGGKVENNYFNVGAVVDHKSGGLFPQVTGLEVRIDGKSKRTFMVDSVSTDGLSIYFTRVDLHDVLRGKQVLIGVNEYLGPQVVMRFDMPDPAPVLEKCGSDRMLKRKGK